MEKMIAYLISECDIYEIYAEGVLSSPADSGVSLRLSLGSATLNPHSIPTCLGAKMPGFPRSSAQNYSRLIRNVNPSSRFSTNSGEPLLLPLPHRTLLPPHLGT